jgi:hypothetical protein
MIRWILLGAVLALGAGCGGDDKEDVAERLESKGTMELMEEAAEDQYTAPGDNRLTEAQVQMYLAVREREAKIAEVSRQQLEEHAKTADKEEGGVAGLMAGMQGLGSVADLLTADIRAAQELGYNTAEYQWIKERVIEASADAFREQAQAQMDAMLEQQAAAAKTALEAATSAEEKQMLEQNLQQIEEMRASSASEPQDPWIAPNRELLAKHENALKALEMEMAKFHGGMDASGSGEEAVPEPVEEPAPE